jgi:DNA-binding NarL/FixJ family response regulator
VIRVLIADDQDLMRAGFHGILAETTDITVAAEAVDGAQAVELALATHPDVVLMDVRMPHIDGIEATRRLCTTPQPPRILILTTFDLDEYVYEGLRAGAAGFLLKDALATDLLTAIRVVAAGQAVVAPTITRRLIQHFVATRPANTNTSRLDVLTPREREVLTLITRGLSNTEIAQTLFLSDATIKTHIGHILAKLDLRDRVHAVILGYETGLVR